MEQARRTRGAVALLAAVGLAFVAALPAMAQPPSGGSGMGGGMGGRMGGGPGGGSCPMMLEWFDDDGDGKITLQEFRRGHDERFVEIDSNGDGKVTIEEFQAAPKPGRQARIQRMFGRMDGDGDGVLSREELSGRAEARFESLDIDGDMVITAEELQQAAPGGRGPGKGTGPASQPPRQP